MKDNEIHIGDVLRIREWDDMAAEFGVEWRLEYQVINCRFAFTDDMKPLCGKKFTVRGINKDNWTDRMCYLSEERAEDRASDLFLYWKISADMLEPFEEEEAVAAPDGSLFDFLMGTKEKI